MHTYRSIGLWVGVTLAMIPLSSQGSPIIGVDRLGQSQEVGTVVRFDSETPGAGWRVGNVGLAHVGALEFDGSQLWAASSAGGVLSFYTIDVASVSATPVSTAGPFTEGLVFGGAFDSQHNFWVTDLGRDRLESYNPQTGDRPSSVPIDADLVIAGMEFVGDTLYAIGNQDFGTLNTQTGRFTALASAPVLGGSQGMDYDPTTGRMFVTFSSGAPAPQAVSELYEVDIQTRLFHSLGVISPWSTLDAVAVIPEPGTIALMAIGVVLLQRRRRRR
jgi:hypothetical protein